MQLQKYEFVVCLTVFEKLLSIVHVAHKLLQSEGSALSTASNLVNNTLLTLEEMRCSDKAWQDIWQGVNELLPSEVCRCEPAMEAPEPRRPKKVSRMEDFVIMSTCGQRANIVPNTSQPISIETRSEIWRKQLFLPVLDCLIGELRRRFVSPESISLSKAVCSALMLDPDGIDSLLDIYGETLKINRPLAKAEMLIAKHVFTDKINESSMSDCTVNDEDLHRIQSVSDQLQNYPNVLKILQLALTLPSTSASCERSFSAMRRVKNYLRTTMGQQRFSSLGLLHNESDLAA